MPNSKGQYVVPKNAVCTGTMHAVMRHVRDSKAQRQDIAIINDAAHAEGKLLEIRRRERVVDRREAAVQAREDAVTEAEAAMLQDAIAKLDDRAKRINSLEAKIRYADLPPSPVED